MVGIPLFRFPGHPVWSSARKAVELRWSYNGETASAWIYGPGASG